MDLEALSVSLADDVATLTLNQPQVLNALSTRLVAELDVVLAQLDEDPAVKVIVLTGAGRHFAAGADIREMLPMTLAALLDTEFSGCCHRLAEVKKPVIAAVNGYALGGGCELVEMCDLVIAAEDAQFGHPEVTVGTMSGAGGTQRLPRAVGKHVAMDMLLSGRTLSAAEAERYGLVSRVVPADRLMAETMAVARRIATFSGPLLRMIKQSVNQAFHGSLGEGLALERRLFHLTFATEDRREGMQAFVEKRRPAFSDR